MRGWGVTFPLGSTLDEQRACVGLDSIVADGCDAILWQLNAPKIANDSPQRTSSSIDYVPR